jgi:hypothetical protein
MKYISLILVLVLSACGNGNQHEQVPEVPLSDFEGEFRVSAGVAQFRVCETYRNFRVVCEDLRSIEISYNNFISIPGDPIKMWISGYKKAMDVTNTGLLDTVIVIKKVLEMKPEQRCPPKLTEKGVGRYTTALQESETTNRKIDLDLFPNGIAIMSTMMSNHKTPAEEEGKWGMNSNGDILLEWPRRGNEMLFTLRNGVLASKMETADGHKLVLERNGDPVFPSGRMLEVIDILKTVAATYRDTSSIEITYDTRIDELIPDSLGMAPIHDILSARYGIDREKLSSRSVLFENAHDVLQFIRHAGR